MKKWKQFLFVAGLICCFGLAVRTDAQAADQVTGLKQTGDSQSRIDVSCDAVLGAKYYYLELSTDGNTWVKVDTSSSPKLDAYSLSAGKSYQARVGLCEDWNGDEKVEGTVSEPIEVVTAPSGTVSVVQTGAKINGISVKGTAVSGANLFQLYYDKVLLGQSNTSTVSSSVKLNPGASYWCNFYTCRKSSTGYIAVGSYNYAYFETLAPAINTKSFGVTNIFENINVYYFGVSSEYKRDGLHFQFATPAGKVKKDAYTTGSSIDTRDFINGNFYKYRVRSYVQCGTKRVFSGWSGYKYIGVPKKGSFKLSKNKKSLTFSFSNVNNATSYTVYSSTKLNSGYKKVKTVSAKKRSVTVSKVGSKKIRKNVTYYFRVVPNAKIGKKTYASQTNVSFYTRIY